MFTFSGGQVLAAEFCDISNMAKSYVLLCSTSTRPELERVSRNCLCHSMTLYLYHIPSCQVSSYKHFYFNHYHMITITMAMNMIMAITIITIINKIIIIVIIVIGTAGHDSTKTWWQSRSSNVSGDFKNIIVSSKAIVCFIHPNKVVCCRIRRWVNQRSI